MESNKLDWIKVDEEGLYSLDDAKSKYEVIKIQNGVLVVNQEQDDGWLRFAVLEGYSEEHETDRYYECEFHGMGFSGNLRECRHTYWGEDGEGYLFYPNVELITSALEQLKTYFDMD